MSIKLAVLSILAIAFILSSCTNNSKIENDLDLIEGYISQYPDSALAVLEALHYEKDLSENNCKRLQLLTIIGKNKVGKSIAEDTTIFSVEKYYEREEDALRASLANLYSGRIYQERENIEKAIECYIDAEEYSQKLLKQDELKGLIQSSIGDLLLQELSIEEAIVRYSNAMNYFKNISDYENIVVTCNSLGISYFFLDNKIDSSSYFFKKGFDIAESNNNRKLMMMSRENKALVLLHQGNIKKSIKYYNEALGYAPSKLDSIHLYFNIGEAYNTGGNIDSALFYVDKLSEYDNDIPYDISKSIYSLKSNILKSKHKYKEALLLYEEFTKYLDAEYYRFKETNLLELNKKYKFELMQNKHNAKLIDKQRVIIGLLLLIVVAIIFGITNYLKSIKNKKKLDEAIIRITEFSEVVENYDSEKDSLKKIVLDHFNIEVI